MITSAGRNALDYALLAPRRIHAVDASPRQTALLELKLARERAMRDRVHTYAGFHICDVAA